MHDCVLYSLTVVVCTLWCMKHDRKECFRCFAGRVITLRPCSTGNTNQQWMRQAPYIRNRATSNKVLAIASEYRLIYYAAAQAGALSDDAV